MVIVNDVLWGRQISNFQDLLYNRGFYWEGAAKKGKKGKKGKRQ